MARTILEEMLGFRPDFNEHQLGCMVRDPNGRTCNRTKFLAERRVMVQAWADCLDQLRAGGPEPLRTLRLPHDPTSPGARLPLHGPTCLSSSRLVAGYLEWLRRSVPSYAQRPVRLRLSRVSAIAYRIPRTQAEETQGRADAIPLVGTFPPAP